MTNGIIPVQRRAYSPKEFSAATGLSLGSVKARIGDGTIRAVKVGGRILIPASELDRILGNGKE